MSPTSPCREEQQFHQRRFRTLPDVPSLPAAGSPKYYKEGVTTYKIPFNKPTLVGTELPTFRTLLMAGTFPATGPTPGSARLCSRRNSVSRGFF